MECFFGEREYFDTTGYCQVVRKISKREKSCKTRVEKKGKVRTTETKGTCREWLEGTAGIIGFAGEWCVGWLKMAAAGGSWRWRIFEEIKRWKGALAGGLEVVFQEKYKVAVWIHFSIPFYLIHQLNKLFLNASAQNVSSVALKARQVNSTLNQGKRCCLISCVRADIKAMWKSYFHSNTYRRHKLLHCCFVVKCILTASHENPLHSPFFAIYYIIIRRDVTCQK